MRKTTGERRALPLALLIALVAVWGLQLLLLVPLSLTVVVTVLACGVLVARRRGETGR